MRVISTMALLAAGLMSFAASASADPTRDDVLANLQRCAGFSDNRTWLNCYYGAAQPMRAQLGLPPAPDTQVSLVGSAPVPQAPPMRSASATPSKSGGGWFSGIGDIFDLNTNSTADSEFGTGAMRLASYSYGKDGLFTATLADGEVWKQSPYDDLRAHWTGPASSYTVMVSADMFGSHTMKVKGDRDYRVIRTK
ncbi:MAG TPA: hypothetical protein VFA87_12100 [Rhizomicrobium sp.]|nr:hypothetical protein [Rhizomicrobium sp.]